MKYKVGKSGIAIIKKSEGFKAKPYLCPAGIPTIGYGTTVYSGGDPVTLKDSPITKAAALQILINQVDSYYGKAVKRYVQVDLNQNQFDALCSFTYNVGVGNFRSSTLLRKLNKGNYDGAAKEFKKWRKANGRVLKGLVKRRKAEKELFIS